jgi:membrane protease YdiL (CAAX protease family)
MATLSLFEVVLCSGVPTQLVLSAALVVIGLTPAVDGQLAFRFVVALSVLDTALILAMVALFLRARGESLRDVLHGSQRLWPEVLRGVMLLPVVFLVVIALGQLILRFAPHLHNVTENPLQMMLTSPGRVAVFAVVAVLAGGVREEVQRAFILHRFRHDLGGAWLGLAVFSIAFGLGHVMQGYDAAVITGMLGLLWGLVYLRRGSVVAPIVSHSLFNLVEIALFQYASHAGLLGG